MQETEEEDEPYIPIDPALTSPIEEVTPRDELPQLTLADDFELFADQAAIEPIDHLLGAIEQDLCLLDIPLETEYQEQERDSLEHLDHDLAVSLRPLPRPDDFTNDLPSDAKYLLDHYRDFTDVLSPIKNFKSLWRIMHLPSALATLGEYVLWKTTSHARLSLFYSLLAVSAFHLDRMTGALGQPGYWWTVAEGYNKQAKQQLQRSLCVEFGKPKKVKYKDLTMAMLNMVTVAVTSGDLENARAYLLDAERLIALKGRPKPKKSRKVKLLHTQWLYLRIIEESTFAYPWKHSDNLLLFTAKQDSSRFPSVANHRLVHKDIHGIDHLENADELVDTPNDDGWSYFAQIYGIPESLIVLLSQATSLATETHLMRLGAKSPSGTDELDQRSNAFEDKLLAWTLPAYARGSCNGISNEDDVLKDPDPHHDEAANYFIIKHISCAFHAALLIYFYRLVRHVEPSNVQHLVATVIEHLHAGEDEKFRHGVNNAGIVWPGFIAACEADDELDFEKLIDWMRISGDKTGIRSFDRAADAAVKVRGAREVDPESTWPDVVRSQKVALVLS